MCVENLKKEVLKLSNKELNKVVEIIENLSKKTFADVVFAGTLSNGKSTVVNALIGKDLLPSSIGSTTANLFVIKRGEDKVVAYGDSKQEFELSKEKLKELNSKSFEKIEIYLEDFPYKNIAFVDTPGINDIDKEKELVSLEYVPFADVVVFVLDISKGLTKEEKEFFESKILKTHKDKIFMLLNKLDTIDDEGEIPEVLKEYQVFKVSAKKYLAGIIVNDKKRIEDSHFLEFKENFENYLNSLDVLNVKKKRIERLLDDILKVGIFQLDEVIKNFSLSKSELENKLNSLKTELKEKEIIVEKALSEIDEKVSEFKKFINERILELKNNLQNLIDKEEIISEFEKFNTDVKNKALEIFKKDIKDYNVEFDLIDNVLFVVESIISNIAKIMDVVTAIAMLLKKRIPPKKTQKITLIANVADQIVKFIKNWKINASLEDNLKSLENILLNEIERITNEEKQNLEFKELAEIKASIYAIETSKKELENQKENIDTKIAYLTQQKNSLQNLISKCKEELC